MKKITDYILENQKFLIKKHVNNVSEFHPKIYFIGRRKERNAYCVITSLEEYNELCNSVNVDTSLLVNTDVQEDDFTTFNIVAWPDIEDGKEFVYVNRNGNEGEIHFAKELEEYADITKKTWKDNNWK